MFNLFRLCRNNRLTCSIRQCCFDIVSGVDEAYGILLYSGRMSTVLPTAANGNLMYSAVGKINVKQ